MLSVGVHLNTDNLVSLNGMEFAAVMDTENVEKSPIPVSGATSVTAVMRALALLDAFEAHDAQLSLAALARRTGLAKPTALRLARSLAAAGYMVALDGGAWRLGPSVARLGARYQQAFDLRNLVEPSLVSLAQQTGHSASFFTLELGQRVRLLRVRGSDGFVSPSRVGEPLPLELGAAGQVILAHTGAPGAKFQSIRSRGYQLTVGEADVSAASIAAPVFGARSGVLGALSIAAPAAEGVTDELLLHAEAVVEHASRLSQSLAAARYSDQDTSQLRSQWHP